MGLEISGFLRGLFPFALAGALCLGLGAERKSSFNDAHPAIQSAPVTASLSHDTFKAVKLRETLEDRANVPQTKSRNAPNPYTADNSFTADTEQMILARALFGESRKQIEQYPDYAYGSARTVINRARRSGKSIKETVLKNNKITWQYTCFNPNDVNYLKLKDPLNCSEAEPAVLQKAWGECYRLAGQALEGNLKGREDLKNVTNYYVGKPALHGKYESSKAAKAKGIPYWVWGRDKKGNLLKDKEGYLVPINPVAQVNLGKAGTAFFYNFKNF